ncbi:MAG: hypothetical protein AAGA48_34515 [Myxococcota bacterium]
MWGWMMWMTAQAGSPVTLNYAAPVTCPSADRFADEVSARLGRLAFGSDGEALRVELREGREQWVGQTRQGSRVRTVQGETCDAVFADLVTAVAVAFDAPPKTPEAPPPPKLSPPKAAPPESLTTYRREHLRIQGLETYTVDGPDQNPAPAMRYQWGVYDGRERLLNTREFLQAAGDSQLLDAFERKHKRQNTAAATLMTIGAGLSLGALTSSLANLDRDVTATEGVAIMSGAVLVSAGAFMVVDRRQKMVYVHRNIELEVAERLADEHNERLRQELGLTAAEAAALD